MADLIGLQTGLALYRTGQLGVIVDTEDLNPFDAQPYHEAYNQFQWRLATPDEIAKAPRVWAELAESSAQFSPPPRPSVTAAASRAVRVPKIVQSAAQTALETISDQLSEPARAVAASLVSGTIDASMVHQIDSYFASRTKQSDVTDWNAYGGKPARLWAHRTNKALQAAAPLSPVDATDPTQPHEFIPDELDPTVCAACGMLELDDMHVPVAEDPSAAKYFGLMLEDSDSTTFKMTGLYALDAGGAWWERDSEDWVPAATPPDEEMLVQLDHESFSVLQTQIDDPDVAVAELSLSEHYLHRLALPGLRAEYDMLDSVFAAVPYVDPQVRSQNAQKQVRDSNGKFVKTGARISTSAGVSGTVKSTNPDGTVEVETDTGTQQVNAHEITQDAATAPAGSGDASSSAPSQPKARLKTPGVLVADVAGLLQNYLAQAQGDASAPTVDPTPVSAAAPPPVPAEPIAPATDAPIADGAAADPALAGAVAPLYLAIVDNEDTQAVLDLVAIIPGDPATNASLEAYKRQKGAWAPSPDLLAQLQGAAPPPVVELQAAELTDVLAQMDGNSEEAPAPTADAASAPAPVAAAGLNRFVLTAAGDLAESVVEAPALLKPYDVYPRDVLDRVSEFVAGVEASPKDVKNTERLRQYWEHGEGAAKIRWGTDGDWTRCVHELSKYLGERAKGYCTLRHKGALGYYPGELDRPGNPKSGEHHGGNHGHFSSVEDLPTLAEFAGGLPDAVSAPSTATDAPSDPTLPHLFVPSDVDPTVCALCGGLESDEVHAPVAVEEVPSSAAFASDELGVGAEFEHPTDPDTGLPAEEPDWSQPHIFEPDENAMSGDEHCKCGQESGSHIHIVVAPVEGVETEPVDEFDQETGFVLLASADIGGGTRFRIPLVVPEGVPSGDNRSFAANSLTSRDVPLALMWQQQSDEGHKQSVIVGRVDHVERLADGGLGNAYGVFDTGAHGQEALRLVRGGFLRGVSADLDEFEANVLEEASEGKITSPKIEVQSGRLMGITLVAKPAFPNCVIELVDGEDEQVPDGEYEESTPDAVAAALTAAGAPLTPPKTWFENPKLEKPTHLTVSDDGRVFGHIASWDTNHIGLPFSQKPPRSVSNYAYFRTGVVRTQEGDDVPVGQLTLWGGHAPLQADARTAVQHYDDTKSAVADLAAGEDRYGIWVSGALRPGIDAEQVRALRASSPSGDWRPINGALELVAVCQVNVPGFPVARSMVAGGMVQALVAAGAAPLVMQRQREATRYDEIVDNMKALNAYILRDKAAAARARVKPAQEQRQLALTAAAQSAKERVDAVRAERDAQLQARADEARARVQAVLASANEFRANPGFRVLPDFEEKKHPRANDGKFRKVYARLMDALKNDSTPEAASAAGKVKDAADTEDSGDKTATERIAAEAQDALSKAAQRAEGAVKSALAGAADDVKTAIATLAEAAGSGDDQLAFVDLPEPVKELLNEMASQVEQAGDPINAEQIDNKMRAWMEGKGFRSAAEVASMIQSYLKSKVKPNSVTEGGPAGTMSTPKPSVSPA